MHTGSNRLYVTFQADQDQRYQTGACQVHTWASKYTLYEWVLIVVNYCELAPRY